jgi:hypothetical protein
LWLQIVFEEIGKTGFSSVNSRKKRSKNGKINKIYKPQNWKKKRKKLWYRGIYICALIIMYGKACCETNDVLLQGPLYMWQTTISTIDSGANMLDLRSEALA